MHARCLAVFVTLAALWLSIGEAAAQNPICALTPTPSAKNNLCASTAWMQSVIAAGITLYPGTNPIVGGHNNGLLYNNGGVLGNLTTGDNGVLATNATGVPSIVLGTVNNQCLLWNSSTGPFFGTCSGGSTVIPGYGIEITNGSTVSAPYTAVSQSAFAGMLN